MRQWKLDGTGLTDNKGIKNILDSFKPFAEKLYDGSAQGRIEVKASLEKWAKFYRIFSFDDYCERGVVHLEKPTPKQAAEIRLLMCKIFGAIVYSARLTTYFRRIYEIVYNVMGLDMNPDKLKRNDERTDIFHICEYIALFIQQENVMVLEEQTFKRMGGVIDGSLASTLLLEPNLYIPVLEGLDFKSKQTGSSFAQTRLGKANRLGGPAKGQGSPSAVADTEGDVDTEDPNSRRRAKRQKQLAENASRPQCGACGRHGHMADTCFLTKWHWQASRALTDPSYMTDTILPQLQARGQLSLSAWHTADGADLVVTADGEAARAAQNYKNPGASKDTSAVEGKTKKTGHPPPSKMDKYKPARSDATPAVVGDPALVQLHPDRLAKGKIPVAPFVKRGGGDGAPTPGPAKQKKKKLRAKKDTCELQEEVFCGECMEECKSCGAPIVTSSTYFTMGKYERINFVYLDVFRRKHQRVRRHCDHCACDR